MSTDIAISTERLTKRFGRQTAVDDLTMHVEAGTVFGFLGRNGAGKTTTIKMLLNMLTPSSGRCHVLGLDPQTDDEAIKRQVGYVDEVPVLYGWMTVKEIVWFTSGFYESWDSALVEDLLARFGLDPERNVRNLSRGMNAQLAFTLALGHKPAVLILDEPATGLDALVRLSFLESIVDVIQDQGRTVFLSSHLVDEVGRVADRVAIIDGGKMLICDDVDSIKQSVKRVVVSADPTTSLTDVPGVTEAQSEGERRVLMVRGYDGDKANAIRSRGGQIVEVQGLSLQQSFVEYVRPVLDRKDLETAARQFVAV